jgi:hypothetical protein
MGYRPTSRTDALLEELCTKYGWCLPPEDRRALIAAEPQDREAITDSIIRAEFGDVDVRDDDKRAFLMPIVDDGFSILTAEARALGYRFEQKR